MTQESRVKMIEIKKFHEEWLFGQPGLVISSAHKMFFSLNPTDLHDTQKTMESGISGARKNSCNRPLNSWFDPIRNSSWPRFRSILTFPCPGSSSKPCVYSDRRRRSVPFASTHQSRVKWDAVGTRIAPPVFWNSSQFPNTPSAQFASVTSKRRSSIVKLKK